MKKIYIAIAVLAAAALTSCQQEQSFEDFTLGENEVAFVLQSSATRAAEIDNPVTQGKTIHLGQVGDIDLLLEETVTDLESFAPETKGIPAFTENVGTIYVDNLGVTIAGQSEVVFESMEKGLKYNELQYDHIKGDETSKKGWRYHHIYPTSIWPDESTPVNFFLRMPADMANVTNLTNTVSGTTKTTSFSYTSPTTAAAQKDIIFGQTSISKSTHKGYLPNGAPVKFFHALTGIKFAIKNTMDPNPHGIKITGISFIGLDNTGSCTVNPGATGNNPQYVNWTSTSATSTTNTISQSFEDGDLVEFNSTNNPDFGSAFFNPGTETTPGTDKQNINSQDGSKTFWLIPQTISTSSAAKLQIDFVYDNTSESMVVNLKDIIPGVQWKAGQLRTYTFKIDEINLKIEDTMSATQKTDVHITNTGDTDAFIRAAIIGQWRDVSERPVFGFTDGVDHYVEVSSWYRDQFVSTADGVHGKFVGLAGYKNLANNPVNGWYLCTDGFYYYSNPVPPGKVTGKDVNGTYTEEKLFTSYTVLTPPAVTLSGVVTDIHFSLEISTQAISANKSDGTHYGWQDAWKRATGTAPTIKTTSN